MDVPDDSNDTDDADDDDDDGDDDMYMMSVCTDLIFVKTFTRPEFFGAKILHENAEIGIMTNSLQTIVNLHSMCKVYTTLCRLI